MWFWIAILVLLVRLVAPLLAKLKFLGTLFRPIARLKWRYVLLLALLTGSATFLYYNLVV